ncbi:glycerol-3-phosphate dehydrogenase [Bartonella sp. HY329]|uniref:glycerol-3-phosphate dehydrogenase n=1 Tax=unclassified Bartonella TaxID=2645622 RepID=UPI0021C9E591|nr:MULTISPECIES: glycerol-3-phosphate dehydrogenase [unclassified Bartonella]UXM94023.1 glycerol-3-phosphate dehydrogenase [Bartonella sp. HY329]UXN08345.1 glycerol-3-phosphate dehydrogenase [Bartonella sp. HY328]
MIKHFDVFIIGGGINGCGLARDAAGRGFSVCLAEMNDLASGASSASTKLIHGGLRYLEQGAFNLVRDGLKERETIWKIAPHIVQPLQFLLPHHSNIRPKWLLNMGMFIYGRLAGRSELHHARSVNLADLAQNPLKPNYDKGFEYYDTQVDDARLAILNARHAQQLGADICVRSKVIAVKIENDKWHITVQREGQRQERHLTASFLVNMAGAWMDSILSDVANIKNHSPIRLVQGSHIVVPRLYQHDQAYMFQNADKRVLFAIPFQQDFTLIGTTDIDYHGDPSRVKITPHEIDYLCAASNEYFMQQIDPEKVIWSFSGIRALYDSGEKNAQETSRDYLLKLADVKLPLLTLYGGKMTTFRKLAEDAMVFIEKHLGKRKRKWTANVCLPGGDFPHGDFDGLEKTIAKMLPTLDAFTIHRLTSGYGTDVFHIFNKENNSFGHDFGHGLFEVEVEWLIAQEWAKTANDILWRRTKLGLRFNDQQREALENYLSDRLAS